MPRISLSTFRVGLGSSAGDNLQGAQNEDAADSHSLPDGDLQPPHHRHGEHHEPNVKGRVENVNDCEERFGVDTSVRLGGVPSGRNRRALEDHWEESHDTPGTYEDNGAHNDAGERSVNAEKAEVESEDGTFDGGHDERVECLGDVDGLVAMT